MRSEQLRFLVDVPAPFVSVYFDDSHDDAESVPRIHALAADIRRSLEDQGAPEDISEAVDRAVLQGRPPVGRRGRGIIANRDGVLVNERLTSPLPSAIIRVSDYPYILPLLELGMSRPTYIFVAVDHGGADVTLHRNGVVTSHAVDGGGYQVHKPATSGYNGYADLGPRVEESIRKNSRAVAGDLTVLVDETGPEVVFVSGEVRARADLIAALPDRVALRVCQLHAGPRGGRSTETEVDELIEAEFQRRRDAEITVFESRLQNELGNPHGVGVQGLWPVCAALRAGDVDVLIVGELGETTVVTGQDRTAVAPDPDVLSEVGQAPRRVARADEALPYTALAIGASVITANTTASPADGIAALLRYPAAMV